ncbi:MAG: glycosyltransferase [Cyclobacteriaceae bacterium]
MNLKDKNILIISPEAWGINYVSKHHYANQLVKRSNKVYFLNPPGSGGSSIVKVESGVMVVDYKMKFRGTWRLPGFLSAILIKLELNQFEKYVGIKFDIIWNFDSSRFFNLSMVRTSIFKICHIVDLNQDLQRPLLASTSDICFGTTKYIVEELSRYNHNSYKIGHGYQAETKENMDFSFKMPGINAKKALYVGNLSMKYIDWELLYKTATAYPKVDLVFVGPDGKSNLSNDVLADRHKELLRKLDNVYFIPPVHSRAIPQLLKMADVLLIAYKEKYHRDQSAPHKMNEYLASGKPILATFTEEYIHCKNRIFMTSRNSEFPLLFSDAINCLKQDPIILTTYEENIGLIERCIHKGK